MTVAQPNTVYALIDINNCYVSCEQVFNLGLNGKAVVVLSNNDGCVVSRSPEAKALNIKMAVPWHEIQYMTQRHGVIALSSNYALYADMSRRFFEILAQHFNADELEPYSIDECFIELTAYAQSHTLQQLAQNLIQQVQQWLGLSCCIGIGHSKTQAKLANHFAKTRTGFDGVCDLTQLDLCSYEQLLLETPVSEVWGIGRQLSQQLQAYAIYTAYDLTFANPQHLSRQFSIVMSRIICELNGQSCLGLDDPMLPSKRILASRSFAHALTDKQLIQQALTFHLNRAHRRLRQQQQLCASVQVSLYEKIAHPPYKHATSQHVGLAYASDDLLLLSQAAQQQIDVLFKENKKYVKVSMMFTVLHPKAIYTHDLWHPLAQIEQREQLNLTLDQLKKRFGQNCVQIGYFSQHHGWQMKQQYRSPRYTTRWQEMLCIDDRHLAVTQIK